MKRMSKWLSFVLILCLLGSMLPFALADGAETETAEETAPAQEAAPAEEAAEAAEEAPAEPTPKDPAAWTVMIYLCGTDLETDGGMATINLKMIANTVPNEKVNVLIQTGGTQSWQAQDEVGMDIASDRLQRWTWDENGYTLVDEQELASMAKHTTLSDFIQWGAKYYPAEKYMLNLWDHGGGSASGLIADDMHDYAIMSLEGLNRALKNGGVHFDLVMTDTCLMASLETAQAVAPYADYLTASQETLPGLGSNYEEWLQCLYDEPECGPARLGRTICDATQILYAEGDNDVYSKSLTFSLIDLSKIDAVADAFNAFMKEVVGLIPDPAAFGEYLNAVSTTDRFMAPEMWDLYDLARRGMKGGISKETAIAVENAVDAAVLYSIRQAYHPYCHGLSVYIQYSDDGRGKLDRLARCCSNPWQLAFLDAVNLKWDAPEWVTDVVGEIPQLKNELYTVKFDAEVSEDLSQTAINLYSGISSGGYIRYELQRFNEQDKDWYALGESEDVKLTELTDDKVSFSANFTGKWPAIDGEFLSIESQDVMGSKVLLQAPIRLFGFKIFKLRILAEYPEDLNDAAPDTAAEDAADAEEAQSAQVVSYDLEGIWDEYNSSTGLVDRNTFSPLELIGMDFDVCRPVYSDYLADNGYKTAIGDMKYSDPIPFTMDLSVEDTVLPAGQYRLRYTIKDMLDRTYYTEFFDLTWDGQNAVFVDPSAEPAE
ncbi:MAG: hypothetical protein J6S60_10810 [Oscillospiraceae bacterium]|nr:hypothetical protein [Oscillospiraceae bacterium]